MSIPKDQHYIPRMLLKRFTDKEGNLYFYDKSRPDRGVRKRGPKNLFYKRHLYTQVSGDGTRDASVETEFLTPMEDAASRVIEKIVSSARMKSVPELSEIEWRSFVKFLYYQLMRLPAVRDKFVAEVGEEMSSKLAVAAQERHLDDYEHALLTGGEEKERHLRNASIKTLQSSPVGNETIEELINGSLCVAVIKRPKPNRSFIIGDFPCRSLTGGDLLYHDNQTIEIWLPLASDVAVALTPGRFDKLKVMKDRKREALNKGILDQSTVIAGCSRGLIESIRERAN